MVWLFWAGLLLTLYNPNISRIYRARPERENIQWVAVAERACGLKGTAACKTVTYFCNYVTSAECNAITSNILPNMKLSSIKLNIIHIQAYMTLILGFIALIFQFSCHFGAISYLNISSTSDECGRARGGSLSVWVKSSLLLHAHNELLDTTAVRTVKLSFLPSSSCSWVCWFYPSSYKNVCWAPCKQSGCNHIWSAIIYSSVELNVLCPPPFFLLYSFHVRTAKVRGPITIGRLWFW